jgi:hypothetical protein
MVTELAASFLSGVCGIENRTIGNSAAYLGELRKKLHNDLKLV